MELRLFFRFSRRIIIAATVMLAVVQAQSAAGADVKHIRIDVANGGLHCPFLGPQLAQKIKGVQTAQNVKLNPQESYITFEVSSTSTIAEGQIREMAVKLGYPQQDVKVTIGN